MKSEFKKTISAQQAQIDLEQAIENLRENNKSLSLSDIAAMLRSSGVPDFAKTNASTIQRWLNPPRGQRESTHATIVDAVNTLREYRGRPMKLRCGVIANAAEMLPLHLLKSFASIEAKPEARIPDTEKSAIAKFTKHVGIQIEVKSMESIDKLVDSMKNDDLDIIAAPRDIEKKIESRNELSSIKRWFKISEASVKALLPLPKNSSVREITEFLRKVKKDAGRDDYIGVLANGDYGHALASFLGSDDVPNTEQVSDSRDAFQKLKERKIQGVFGHRIMIENTFALIQHAIKSDDYSPHFGKLNIVGENSLGVETFGVVKMDIFVNVPEMKKKPGLAAKVFHLVLDAVEQEIGEKKHSPAFHKKVNGLLDLEDIGIFGGKRESGMIVGGRRISGTRDAKDLFSKEYQADYKFEIKTFVTDTLKQLWV